MNAVFRDGGVMELPVAALMGPRMPTIGIGQSIDRMVALLDTAPALVVLSGGRPVSVLSRTDVLAFLEQGAR
jgi:cystathionine beta-synthase